MLPKNWQELLDDLTSDIKNSDLINKISNHRDQENVIKICLNVDIRNKLLDWIQHVRRISKWEKSASRASSFRSRGNEKFRDRNNNASLALYTESVIHAPLNSEEKSIALANRSAVLFHMQAYRECLRDISLALQHGYPESLCYKLHLRRGQCLTRLGQHQEAVETLKIALESLNKTEDSTVGKKSLLRRDLDAALAAATAQLSVTNCDNSSRESLQQVPVPVHGENEKFLYASAALDLRFNEEKGRHVVTNRDVVMGDILFVEKPYAFVVLPDQYKTHCHHCCVTYIAPVPCLECTMALYCSEDCRQNSWQEYHQWECRGGLELLHSIGVAHLGLRVVLKAGPLPELKVRYEDVKGKDVVGEVYGDKADNYAAVYHLMPHIDEMQPEDLFQYALTATMLTVYLSDCTDFFSSDKSAESLVGGLILRHITQLVCNAHAITKLDTVPPESEDQKIVTEHQVRVATAIYPSASMMNHSCDPSIINSFHNELLIVKACKDVPAGGEIYNCYGPHFRHMGLQERQDVLRSQYFFKCTCDPCSLPLQLDFQERFSALLCCRCAGPLLRSDKTSHEMTCSDCGYSQDYSSHVEATFKAHALYNDGCEALEHGSMKEAVSKFESCWELRRKCLYRSHKDLTTCADQIGKCYALLGDYNRSVRFLLCNLPAIEEQFGSHSIELANELQKLSDVMMCDLQQQQIPNSDVYRERHAKATETVKRARRILELHYGGWNSSLRDIIAKEQLLLQLK